MIPGPCPCLGMNSPCGAQVGAFPGAAFGTAVSNTFVGLFMFSAVMIRENPLKVPLHTCLHPQKNIILRMIGIGTPVAFERAIVASGQVVSTRLGYRTGHSAAGSAPPRQYR